jgi:cytochrome c553
MYYRWEYVDRNFGDAQGVWTTNPDGTNHALYWGNNTASPGGVIDAVVLPGESSVFLATLTSCHDKPWGAIGLIDRRLGLDGKDPILQTWSPEAMNLVQEVGVDLYDRFAGLGQKFEDPFPLSDSVFLATGTVGRGEVTGIWVLERDGGQTLVHVDDPGCFDPIPVVATTPPPVIVDRIDLSQTTGTFYVSNVYEGLGMQNVEPGSVKFLRVIESPEKRSWTHPSYDGGTGQQAPGMAWKDFNNKRILGTVPVEADGSVQFKVPADTFVYFQILDENGMMIQSMRSGTIVRPGEVQGCYGCHEDRLATFPQLPYTPAAMRKQAQTLSPWYGEPRLFSYIEEVQPVLDKYCVACHDYGQDNGEGKKKPVLAGDLTLIFNKSYTELWRKKLISAVGAGPVQKLEPYSWGSHKSRIVEVLRGGHPRPEIDAKRKSLGIFLDAKSDPEAFDRIVTWIDLNAPYYPTYSTAYPNNRFGRSPLDDAELQRIKELTGTDQLWSISLTRPEVSPSLATASNPQAVMDILRVGAQRLTQQPRGESCDFQPVDPTDIQRAAKYDQLKELLQEMRRSEIEGKRLHDTK